METKDYSRRTSKMYDDRDGDVVTRLDNGTIKVCEGEAPKMAFFLVPCAKPQTEDEVPSIDLTVECYVRMDALSKETRNSIRQDLGLPIRP